MTRRTILCLLVIASSSMFAQNTGKISGMIVDARTGASIPSANVIIRGTSLGSVSDLDGKYFILNVPPGIYEVAASIVGFRSVVQRDVIVNLNRTTTVDFSLVETAIEGEEVVVTAVRPDVEREKTSTSEIRRGEEVMNVPGIQDITNVLSLSSDISDGHFRGGRDNEELYNLQGMGIMNPLSSSSAFNPIMSAVEEVEVITSGFGAQYGNAQSGVVNITMKEGSADKWRARGEIRRRAPGLKHFGPSLWDSTGNPYLRLLGNPSAWSDSTNTTSIAGITTMYGKDRVTQTQLLYALYLFQGHRDFMKTYDDLVDYSADVNFGGPLANDVRVFGAFHLDNVWPFLPTPEPNVNLQFMGNAVYDVGKGMTLRFSSALARQETHTLGGRSSDGWIEWIWDRVYPVTRSKSNNVQAGLRWAHALSASTFYEIKLNTLQTSRIEGSPVTDPNYLSVPGLQKPFWISTWQPNPDGFSSYGRATGTFEDEKTRTVSIDAAITSQATDSHMLMAGVQGSWYLIDVQSVNGVDNNSGGTVSAYIAKPFEVGFYIQDKMEFEGMISTVGLRLDVYSPNVFYYKNIFAPLDYTDSLGVHHFEPLAPRERTASVARLQPRLGFSFPVSENTVFHVNYGTFLQRPTFDQILTRTFSRLNIYNVGGASSVPDGQTLGNPRLKPQTTNSYDVGVTQGLGEGFTLDISGYYKDVKNLVQRALYYPSSASNVPYLSYINREYANIRGFRVGLAKRKGMLMGTLSYTYGVATGKRSSADAYSYPTIYESGPTNEPIPQDILLDFDRTHNLVANLGLTTPENWGPVIFDINPFELWTIAATAFLRSGRPYSSWLDTRTPMNKRAPNESTTNIKITRNIPRFFGIGATFYLEIANLFNDRIYDYDAVFNPNPANNANLQRFTVRYEKGEDIRYYDNENYPEFLANQEFRIYSNAPRSWTMGMVINF